VRYVSTRTSTTPRSISRAIVDGLAPDGGLFVPREFPPPRPISARAGASPLHSVAAELLAPFFAGDHLLADLPALCAEALDFDTPLVATTDAGVSLLELFHGPTAAFKDVGARFLAATLARLERRRAAEPLIVLVATSGDTGAAVAAAFHRRPGFHVVVLYPNGRVSARQAHQLSCFDGNVTTLRVDGSFDDCQRMVKSALSDVELRRRRRFTSANSINLGRLLPQMAYFARAAAAEAARTGVRANFAVPTGNLGNALACLWAKRCGAPIDKVALATNANRGLVDLLATGVHTPRASVPTIANAMDVGVPSNLERLLAWLPGGAELRGALRATSASDAELARAVARAPKALGHVVCPHTAAGLVYIERQRELGDTSPWVAVATAHPAKFESIVEPLVGRDVVVPPALAALLARPARAHTITADDRAFVERMMRFEER
jgi:threonine synthase